MRGPQRFKTSRARILRKNSTDTENKLWHRLRSRGIDGHKFVRQVPVGPYIADFVCREKSLIIEVDGGQHADNLRDVRRDRWLTERNYRVLRFWNNEVLCNMDGVLEVIAAALSKDAPHPPAFGGRPLPASGER